MPIVDHVTDKGALLGLDLSQHIREDEYEKLEKSAFAWPELRLFPIHTPVDAINSALYLEKQASQGVSFPEEVKKRIAQALVLHNVAETFKKVASQLIAPELEKQARKLTPEEREKLPDSVFGLVIKKPDGTKIRKYPMPDANHVLAAIKYFKQNYKSYPEEWRRQIAKKIVQQARKFGVEVHDEVILSYAGVKPKEKKANLKKAAALVREFRVMPFWYDERAKEAYEKVAKVLEEYAEKEDELRKQASDWDAELEKVAQILEDIDKAFGVDYNKLPAPVFLIWNEEPKKMVKLASQEVAVEALQMIPDEVYKDLTGQVPNREKFAEWVEGLDKSAKELIEQFLQTH